VKFKSQRGSKTKRRRLAFVRVRVDFGTVRVCTLSMPVVVSVAVRQSPPSVTGHTRVRERALSALTAPKSTADPTRRHRRQAKSDAAPRALRRTHGKRQTTTTKLSHHTHQHTRFPHHIDTQPDKAHHRKQAQEHIPCVRNAANVFQAHELARIGRNGARRDATHKAMNTPEIERPTRFDGEFNNKWSLSRPDRHRHTREAQSDTRPRPHKD
jgi:hypothetical protein